MSADIEDRLRRAASAIQHERVVPPEVLRAIERRRRRHLTVVATVTTTAAVIAATSVALLQAGHGHQPEQQVSIGPAGKSSPATPTPATTPSAPATAFPALPSPPAPSPAAEPTTFIGAIGAGDERLAVVQSSSGHVIRYLQSAGSQELRTFNADRTIAYQASPSLATCAATWVSVNLTTGAQRPAFTGLDNPDEVALSPNGSRLAYTSIGPQKIGYGQNGSFRRGCPTAKRTLVIEDSSTSQQVSIPLGHGGGESVFPTFDTTGNLLAVKAQGHIRVLNLTTGASLTDATVVPTPKGCDQVDPAFQPGTDQLMLATDCHQDAELDGYTLHDDTWTLTFRKVVASQPESFLASFAYDASGKHLIYSVDDGQTSSGAVYITGTNGDRHVADGIYQVAW